MSNTKALRIGIVGLLSLMATMLLPPGAHAQTDSTDQQNQQMSDYLNSVKQSFDQSQKNQGAPQGIQPLPGQSWQTTQPLQSTTQQTTGTGTNTGTGTQQQNNTPPPPSNPYLHSNPWSNTTTNPWAGQNYEQQNTENTNQQNNTQQGNTPPGNTQPGNIQQKQIQAPNNLWPPGPVQKPPATNIYQ